jgi:hypothetical protein
MKFLRFTIVACTIPVGVWAQYFTRITNSPVATDPGDSRSVNWIDVNGDGAVDCFISNGPQGGQNNTLYLNDGAGNFTAVLQDTIVQDNAPSDGATFADIDNDGDLDAFVVNWYNHNNLMYTNNGDGTFNKIAVGAAVTDAGYSETAAWADYDMDGLVDLYVTNSAGNKKNFLYHNEGNGQFTRIEGGDIVNDAFFSRNISWADIDNDGDLDAFVTNEEAQNEQLYRNDGQGNFTKVSTGDLVNDGGHTMSSSWADFDNDGDLDVVLANDRGFNSLFRNDGNLNFTKLLSDTVCTTPSRSFSSAWGDIDNDGDLDLFFTNSFAPGARWPNFLYINNGDGSFSRINQDITTTDSGWSYGCAFADYNNDGFLDLAVATCRFAGADEPNYLYQNNGNGNNWLSISLEGRQSNRSCIGARVYVKAMINGNAVWQMRELSAQSAYCGQNDMRAHFGLGDATMADSVRVVWPSGQVEHFAAVAAGQFVHYKEMEEIHTKDHIKGKGLCIYPNPARDHIWMELAKDGFAGSTEVAMYGMDGKLILKTHFPARQLSFRLDIENKVIASGNYLFQLRQGNNVWVRKVTIE